MTNKNQIGKIYEFCHTKSCCPIAVEKKVDGKSGLEIKDDFGGSVKLTDENLKDLRNFLNQRFGGR
jgi:hypothetical protein